MSPSSREIWVATGNAGKLKEIQSLLTPLGFEIHSQSEIDGFTPRKETGKTFEENARIKVGTLATLKTHVWILGEDSGLEVEGLENQPGIYSARYTGENASDSENTEKILEQLKIQNPSERRARFITCLVARSPQGKDLVFHGTLEGKISETPQGSEGFGYDPIFIPENEKQTLAELGQDFKNKISHRAQALQKLIKYFENNF